MVWAASSWKNDFLLHGHPPPKGTRVDTLLFLGGAVCPIYAGASGPAMLEDTLTDETIVLIVGKPVGDRVNIRRWTLNGWITYGDSCFFWEGHAQ